MAKNSISSFLEFKQENHVAFSYGVIRSVGRHSKKRFPTYKTQIGTVLVNIHKKLGFCIIWLKIAFVVFLEFKLENHVAFSDRALLNYFPRSAKLFQLTKHKTEQY